MATYTETETDPAFLGNKAVFARNWPYMYALAGTEDFPDVKPEQIGVAPLPVAKPGNSLASALGGWNMLINAQTDMPDEAWEFVQWMTASEQQKWRALEASLLPTRPALYSGQGDQGHATGRRAGRGGAQERRGRARSHPTTRTCPWRCRSSSTRWSSGDTSPEDAVASLQASLEQIVEAGG